MGIWNRLEGIEARMDRLEIVAKQGNCDHSDFQFHWSSMGYFAITCTNCGKRFYGQDICKILENASKKVEKVEKQRTK